MASVSGEELWRWKQDAVQQLEVWVSERQDRPDYLYELDWLLATTASLDRLALRLESFRALPHLDLTRSLQELSQLWQQRLEQRVPMQYLLGYTTWRNLILEVAPGVLIPRPETELLIDLAQAWVNEHPILRQDSIMRWADLGTGSGAIALGLAQSFPQADIYAVDLSPIALEIARRNAKRLQPSVRPIHFYLGEWLAPLNSLVDGLDGIISNPPYIPHAEIPTLQPEVSRHEPHLALDGGEDGLDSISWIVKQTPQYLRSGGMLLLEMMGGQGALVKAMLQNNGLYCNIQTHLDLSGVERFTSATRL
jgi:release factor glutamine methyltransferase